jgi:hypothetical protein
MTDHPVKVPPKLVGDWLTEAADLHLLTPTNLDYLANRAAQWAADQELEACCDWIEFELRGQLRPAHRIAIDLRDARRPKPPSLAEQAGAAHARASFGKPGDRDILAAALTRLAELEAQQ